MYIHILKHKSAVVTQILIDIYRYILNTDVDTPHQGRVSQVCFAPPPDPEYTRSQYMLVTVGAEDNKFKLWSLTTDDREGKHNVGCEIMRCCRKLLMMVELLN